MRKVLAVLTLAACGSGTNRTIDAGIPDGRAIPDGRIEPDGGRPPPDAPIAAVDAAIDAVVSVADGPLAADAAIDAFVTDGAPADGGIAASRAHCAVEGDTFTFANNVVLLSNGDAVIAGEYFGAGDFDIFVARYTADCQLVWLKSAGGDGRDNALAITAGSDDTIYVTGAVEDGATFGAGEANETTVTGEGLQDVFVASFAPDDGSLNWVRTGGGADFDIGIAIAMLADGTVAVTGNLEAGTVTFGKGEANETTTTVTTGTSQMFVARYQTDGDLAWAKFSTSATNATNVWGYGIAGAPASAGGVYVVGFYDGDATFGPGETNETMVSNGVIDSDDIFVGHLAIDGSLDWLTSWGGPAEDQPFAAAVAADGSVLVTGANGAGATFGSQTISEAGIFIARHDAADGADLSVQTIPGLANGEDIDVAAGDGRYLATGPFGSPSLTFGKGESNETTIANEPDSNDGWIASFDAAGTLRWAERMAGGTNGSVTPTGMSVAADGSSAVTGYFGHDARFGSVLLSGGDQSFFLVFYAP